MAIVRWGRRPGVYECVAYPAARDREDRLATTRHRVPLLSAAVGDTVYFQAIDVTASGHMTPAAEIRAVVSGAVSTGPRLRWTMIDVGFGDAHLLTMPGSGRRVLIDAGERRDAANVMGFLAAAGVGHLDVVLATHVHADHIGGMVGEPGAVDDGVLGAWSVGEYVEGPAPSGERAAHDELLATIAARGLPRRFVSPGDTQAGNPALAWDPEVRVEALNAGGGRAIGGETESDWINNDSVVLRVGYGDVDLVLGGDAEAPVQARMLAAGRALESEVLKVHHHGVDDASEPAYLSAVRPRVGLIPIATEESFSGTLPAGVVLSRLRERAIDVYASDRAEPLGLIPTPGVGYNVTVVTDGNSYEVRLERSASVHWPPEAAERRVVP